MRPVARWLMGGGFAVAGLVVEAVALDVITVDPASIHAPRWILLTVGGMFTLAGLWIVTAGTAVGGLFEKLVGPVVVIGMLAILHWIAFGPGVRRCTGEFSIPFFSSRGPVGDLGCRIGFGWGALIFDGALLSYGLGTFAERRLEGAARKVVKGFADGVFLVALAPFLLILGALAVGKGVASKARSALTTGRRKE
jgi:hypothetical protein